MSLQKKVRAPSGSALRFDPSAMVKIRVGKLKDFVVHKSALSRSEFFCRALTKNREQSLTHVVYLPDDSPEVFEYYLNHAYTNQIPTMTELMGVSKKGKDKKSPMRKEFHTLFLVYILAEKLQDLHAKNGIMEAVFEVYASGTHAVPEISTVTMIYDRTPQHSPARRFVVDAYMGLPKSEYEDISSQLRRDFLQDLLLRAWPPRRSETMKASAYLELPGKDSS